MQNFLDRIAKTIDDHQMLNDFRRLVVGVSGGADSVALLCALAMLRDRYELMLTVAHLNHRIRGIDAEEDESFVRELAETLGVTCVIDSCDVPALSLNSGVSIEMAARNARQDFFREVIQKVGADAVAVAHTSDDQVETVLLRLFRGCGLLGLSGIPYSNEVKGIQIVRPMRDVTHQDAERFLLDRGCAWREDESNQDDDFLRNRVRHEVLPILEDRLNPRVRKALLRMSDIARADNDWLDHAAGQAFAGCVLRGKEMALSIEQLHRLPLAEQRRVIMKWLSDQHVEQNSLDAESIRRIEQLSAAMTGSKSVPLKSGWQVTREYNRLVLQRRSSSRRSRAYKLELNKEGMLELPEQKFCVTMERTKGIIRQKNAKIGDLPLMATVSAEAVGDDMVYVRSWRFGDVFQPLGMQGHKKVQDVFVNRKVPRLCRGTWPLIECRGEIIWIPGYQIAKGWELSSDDEAAYKITIEEWKGAEG